MNQPSSARRYIRNFSFGILAGLFIAAIYWSYSAYFQVSFSLAQGIISSLFLAISCGIIATIVGLDKLMDNFPPL